MNVFETTVLQLPEEALHANGGIRFETIGEPLADGVEGSSDDWFIDDIELAQNIQFVPPQNLGIGRYRFWVRAFNSLEQPGLWSAGRDFLVRTPPEIISPVAGGSNAESTPPVIQWTTVVNSSYDLWVNNVTTGESQVIREQNLETTSFATATAGLAGGTYRAWVRAKAPDGITGEWSSPVTFSILDAPEGLQPTGATFDRTPELVWNEVDGAEFYFVWLSRRDPGEPATIVLIDRFVEGTSRAVEQDLEFGQYVFWVRSVGADGSSSQWSQPAEFFVGGRPDIVSPDEDATVGSMPTIIWTGVAGAARYEIWFNRLDIPINRFLSNTTITTTSFTVPQELESGEYRVWVRAVSDMGENSFWSLPVDFTVASNTESGESENTTLLSSLSIDVLNLQSTLVVSPVEELVPVTRREVEAARQIEDDRIVVESSAKEIEYVPVIAEYEPASKSEEALDQLMAGLQPDWVELRSDEEEDVVL